MLLLTEAMNGEEEGGGGTQGAEDADGSREETEE